MDGSLLQNELKIWRSTMIPAVFLKNIKKRGQIYQVGMQKDWRFPVLPVVLELMLFMRGIDNSSQEEYAARAVVPN
jgi:hypothetical protein